MICQLVLDRSSLTEAIDHDELRDMPDTGGTNSDHDNRYLTLDGSNADQTIDIQGQSFIAGDTTASVLTLTNSTVNWKFTKTLVDTGTNTELGLQSQTSGADTRFSLFSKDGDGTDNVFLHIYGAGTPTDRTNEHRLELGWAKNPEKYRLTINGHFDILNSSGSVMTIDNSTGAISFPIGRVTAPAFDISTKLVTVTTFTDEGINAAIDLLGSDGGLVILPEGTYTINAEITIDFNNTTLQGAGAGTILKVPDGEDATITIINVSDKDNTTIRDLVIDGNRANQSSGSQIGIHFTACDNLRILHCGIKNIYGTTGDGIRSDKTTIPTNILIDGCHIDNCDDDAIDINAASHSRIVNCFIENIDDNGIDTEGSEYLTMSNNIITTCAGAGIEFEQEEASPANTTRYCEAAGNSITDCGIGIRVNSGSHNSIVGNTIENSTTDGILLDNTLARGDANYNTVVGNTIITCGDNGIEETANNADFNLITANTIISCTGVSIVTDGVHTQAFDNNTDDFYIERRVGVFKNTSGGSVALGDIVVWKTAIAAGNEFTTTTTSGDEYVLGMALETINDNASGYILLEGKTIALKVNGILDIAVGDLITPFTTVKIGKKALHGDTAFAKALEAYTGDDSSGVIDAILIKKFASSPFTRDAGNTFVTPRTSGDFIRANRFQIEDANSAIYEASNDMTFVDANTGPISLATLAAAGAAAFLGLTDTPGSYSGEANKIIAVNAGETALEYVTAGAGSVARSGNTTDNRIVRWHGTNADTIQDSAGPSILDTGDLVIPAADKLYMDGGTNSYYVWSGSGGIGARISTYIIGTERLGLAATQSWMKSDVKVSATNSSPDATFEIETGAAEGHQALTIDQNDQDRAFIDYQGTSSADLFKNISTTQGAGTLEGPKGQNTTEDAWSFSGMIKIEVNGVEYWMPYYSSVSSGC